MNQECISEEMSNKDEMIKETMYNGYMMFSTLVCLYGLRLGKSLCISMIKLEV
jgi:hypothetical protein